MIARMIFVTVPKEKAAEAKRFWKTQCAPVMIQQSGCLSEQSLRSSDNPGEMISLPSWQDQKSIDQYRSGPGHQEILKHTRGLMGVSKVDVKNYEVVGKQEQPPRCCDSPNLLEFKRSSFLIEERRRWSGGTGRRTRLKIWRPLRSWGFDSPLQHHLSCSIFSYLQR